MRPPKIWGESTIYFKEVNYESASIRGVGGRVVRNRGKQDWHWEEIFL